MILRLSSCAMLRSKNEARMKGTPGRFKEVLKVEY